MKRKRVLLLLCILSCTLQLFAQQINVQGVVYDPSGETVPGANVSMKSNPAVGTYGAQNEAYMSRSAEKLVRDLCFNELGVGG